MWEASSQIQSEQIAGDKYGFCQRVSWGKWDDLEQTIVQSPSKGSFDFAKCIVKMPELTDEVKILLSGSHSVSEPIVVKFEDFLWEHLDSCTHILNTTFKSPQARCPRA